MTAGQCTPSLWCNIIVRDTSTAFFRTSGQTRPNQTHNPCGRSGAPPSFGRLSGFVTLTPFLSNGLGSDRVPVNVWLSMRSIPPGGSGHSCQKGCPGLYNGAAAPGASSTSERAGSCSGRMLNPKQQGANEHHMKEGNQYGPAGRRLLRRADMASAVGCYDVLMTRESAQCLYPANVPPPCPCPMCHRRWESISLVILRPVSHRRRCPARPLTLSFTQLCDCRTEQPVLVS